MNLKRDRLPSRARTDRRIGRALAALATAMLTALTMAPTALAAGSGSGGGQGSQGGQGGQGSGESTGTLYSDLVVVLRAETGTPILNKYVVPATETDPASAEYCVQPVSYERVPGLTAGVNPVDGRQVWILPLQGEWLADPIDPLPVAEIEACDPQPQYAMFVKEVELERLNLARTADEVIARKIADVDTKLRYADSIALESTGRLSYDGTPIDASPENAAIYQSLMTTGTIPGLPAAMAGPPAAVGPAPGDGASHSRFSAWDLAAMAIGAAASKTTPLTLDAVEYYNRIIGFPPSADPTANPPVPEYQSPWGVNFVRSADPADPAKQLADSEQFVDYSHFSYNRSQTFKGSVTWLDVPTLTWKVSKITDIVPFTNLSSYPEIGTHTLTGLVAFAQLADDVRAMCNFIPDNTFIPGFYMDVPGVDTTAAQLRAIHDPAVSLGALPQTVFETMPFQATASLFNPFGGAEISGARLRLTVHAPQSLAAGDLTAIAADGQAVPFTLKGNGDLEGWWGPAAGFPVQRGYNLATTFDVTIADGAPTGAYQVTLDLVTAADESTVLAQATATLNVSGNVATVLWGAPVVRYATQGSAVTLPVRVYSPSAGTGRLTLTVTGPGDDPTTPGVTEALTAGDVTVYVTDGSSLVRVPMTLDGQGHLVGGWDVPLAAGYTSVAWYVTVAEGAQVGNYAYGFALDGANALSPAVVAISAVESHGNQPPGSGEGGGEDSTAPVATLTPVGTLDATATFTLSADQDGVTFECTLAKDGAGQPWQACTSPVSYTGLQAGAYVFSARGTNSGGLVSAVVTRSWTVSPPSGGGGDGDGGGGGSGGDTGAAITTPGAPTQVAATVDADKVIVSFSAPVSDGGAPITGYVVTPSPACSTCTGLNTTSTSTTITGLIAGTSYTFTVTATNSAGDGSASAGSNAVTTPAAAAGRMRLTNPGTLTGSVGLRVSVRLRATDAAKDAVLAFTATGLPAGLRISSAGLITGTPNRRGTYRVTAVVRDGAGASAAAAFAVVVRARGGCLAAAPYEDVPVNSVYCRLLTWAKQSGLSGMAKFHPTVIATRQLMAVQLYRLLHDGRDAGRCGADFAGIPASDPRCGDTRWVVQHGLMLLTSNGSFLPGRPVTRSDVAYAVYVLRNGHRPPRSKTAYAGMPASNRYTAAAWWVVRHHIMPLTHGKFLPTARVPRVQLIVWLYRAEHRR